MEPLGCPDLEVTPAQLVRRVSLVWLGRLEQLVSLELLEQRVTRVLRDHWVLAELKGHLELKDPPAILDSRELAESLVRVDSKALRAQVESKVPLALLVSLEIQASPAYKAVQVRMETLGKQDRLVHLVNRARLVTREQVVTLGHLVMLDKWDHQD